MIASINQIAGRNDCQEAIVLQQRPAWVVAVAAAVVVLVRLLLPGELGNIASAALAGACMGIIIALMTTNVLVGRCGDQVVMAKASTWRPANATQLLGTIDAPVKASIDSGFVVKKVSFYGETYLLSKALEKRFLSVIR